MPHLDQHSALPPESITGCDNNAPIFFFFFFKFTVDDVAAAGSLLSGDGDYDVVEALKMNRDAFY